VDDAARQPEHLANAEVIGELLLNLLAAQGRVAPGAEQAGFGGKQRTFSIGMDRAAFQHKIAGIITLYPQRCTERRGNGIIFLPVGIETVYLPAPGIETPADSTQRVAVGHK